MLRDRRAAWPGGAGCGADSVPRVVVVGGAGRLLVPLRARRAGGTARHPHQWATTPSQTYFSLRKSPTVVDFPDENRVSTGFNTEFRLEPKSLSFTVADRGDCAAPRRTVLRCAVTTRGVRRTMARPSGAGATREWCPLDAPARSCFHSRDTNLLADEEPVPDTMLASSAPQAGAGGGAVPGQGE